MNSPQQNLCGKRRDRGLSYIGMDMQFRSDRDGRETVLSGAIVPSGSLCAA